MSNHYESTYTTSCVVDMCRDYAYKLPTDKPFLRRFQNDLDAMYDNVNKKSSLLDILGDLRVVNINDVIGAMTVFNLIEFT